MELNPISASSNPVVQERAARRAGRSAESVEPPAPSPNNGMPPPVGDVIVVSDAARARLEAWESRQGRTGLEHRVPQSQSDAAPAAARTAGPTPDGEAPEA